MEDLSNKTQHEDYIFNLHDELAELKVSENPEHFKLPYLQKSIFSQYHGKAAFREACSGNVDEH